MSVRNVEAPKHKILMLNQNPEMRCEMGRAALGKAQEMTSELYGRRSVEFYTRLEMQN